MRPAAALLTVVVLGLAALAPARAWAEGATFEVQGQARIVNEDRVAARRRAVEDALRQAVDRAVDGLLGPEVRTARPFEVRAALGQARALVARYRVLAESEAAGLFQVTIEATVDPQRLGAVVGRSATPRAAAAGPAVVLRPQAGADVTALRQALVDAGVAVVAAGNRELRVTHSALVEGEVRGAGVWSARDELAAELTGPGTPVPALTAQARRFAPDAAAARASAARAAAADLARSVAHALAPVTNGGWTVRLVGRFGYRHLRALSQALVVAPQVGAVTPRRFGHRWADLSVRTTLTPAELGRRLGQLTTPGLNRVVERADEAEVRVRLEVTDGEAPEGLP